jgi:magnesium transporter
MIRRFAHQGVQWIDLECPTVDEVAEIANEFSIGVNLVYELVTPTEKPRVDVYPDSVYAVFHFPSIRRTHARDETEEIDVILGRTYLITAHYRPVEAIDDFARSFEVAELLKRGPDVSSGYLLFELAGHLYRESESELDVLEEVIGEIEQTIFAGHERQMVTTISKAGRELLVHKRILGNHTETLEALQGASVTLFGEQMRNYFHGVAALHYRAYTRAVSMADIVAELRETNMALLSTRQNEIMKNLTIITSVMLPLTLVANIFSMNTKILPIVGSPHDFWIIVAIMAVVTAIFGLYFRAKKWF